MKPTNGSEGESDESPKADAFGDRLLARSRELENAGVDSHRAHGIAWLEERIRQWPSGWGDDLQVLIYGDFEPPEAQMEVPSLGIVVHPEKIKNTVIRSALCVLKATVKVKEKNVESLINAARRVNVFLGAYTLVEWGNAGCGWWSWVTHGGGGGVMTKVAHPDLVGAVIGIQKLPDQVRRKVEAALYWIREPKNTLLDFYRSNLLRTYSAYWNAFECLVDAIGIMRPRKKQSKHEKMQLIQKLVAEHGGNITPNFVQDAYKLVVDPGIVAKASHALEVCFGPEAKAYIHECFRLPDKRDRLYDIRNSINHADIDAENPEELLRIESRLSKLWMIVWRMFGKLIPFPAPLDSKLQENSQDGPTRAS